MKKAFVLLFFICYVHYTYAQSIVGSWYGNLSIQGTELPLVFHITQTGNNYTSTMDSPKQGAKGMPTGSTIFLNNQLTVEAPQFGIKYTGTYRPDSSKITGTFMQGGMQLPLTLTPKPPASAALVARLQDPKTFPYRQEEVKFTNAKANVQLAGTLTLPSSGTFSKVVVLLSGSGPQNRNEEIEQFNHRPFLVWSDWLTRNGVAVLRYDDRGVGESTGNFHAATSADFADDAEAAVVYLQKRPDMKGVGIGLLGHSEGGMIAPMVASRNKAVSFMVLLAAPGVPISELMARQTADQTVLAGASEKTVELNVSSNQKMYDAIMANSALNKTELENKLTVLLKEDFKRYPAGALGNVKLDDVVSASVKQVSTPWFRYFIGVNPANYLTQVKCPVLALNGSLDMQVNSRANLAGIKSSLQRAGNTRHQEIELPGLNHLFQQAKRGSMTEYAQIEETVNAAALQKVADWIKAH